MSTPYLGEIKIVSFTYAPKGYAQCNGQLLPINQNQALFSLLGTYYGGNGINTFALPNMQGNVAVAAGSNHLIGESAGVSTVSLQTSEMPAHTHTLNASDAVGTSTDPTGNLLARPAAATPFALMYNGSPNAAADPSMIGQAGQSQPHENRMPYLVLLFVIALQGIFPSRS